MQVDPKIIHSIFVRGIQLNNRYILLKGALCLSLIIILYCQVISKHNPARHYTSPYKYNTFTNPKCLKNRGVAVSRWPDAAADHQVKEIKWGEA